MAVCDVLEIWPTVMTVRKRVAQTPGTECGGVTNLSAALSHLAS